jgi:hypothetical protein
MKKKILVTANDFGSTKSNSSQSPKHHFCYECARACCISSSHLILSSTASLCKARARTPTNSLTAFVATAPRVALIFVARIVNIVSCNKKIFFMVYLRHSIVLLYCLPIYVQLILLIIVEKTSPGLIDWQSFLVSMVEQIVVILA